MNLTALTRPSAPWLHLLTCSPAELSQAARDLTRAHPRLAVRVLRGGKCPNRQSLFNEAAAALQFPLTFGENWDAFCDCLTDLAWLEADGYVLFFADADLLLTRCSEEHADTLWNLLVGAVETWNTPENGPAKPFHLVFHGRPGREKAVQSRWRDPEHRRLNPLS